MQQSKRVMDKKNLQARLKDEDYDLIARLKQREKEALKEAIKEEFVLTDKFEEAIYAIDDLYVSGEYSGGVRGFAHEILLFEDDITYEKLIEHGTIIVPEAQTVIGELHMEEANALQYKMLETDSNQYIGKPDKIISDVEREAKAIKDSKIIFGSTLAGADDYASDLMVALETGKDCDGADIPNDVPEERNISQRIQYAQESKSEKTKQSQVRHVEQER